MIVGLVLAVIAVAVVGSYSLRNTSGARSTNEPGAMAGNLAVVFVAAVVAVIVVVALVGSR